LLSANSRQKIIVGDMTIVFWAECKNLAEDFFADLIAPQQAETPNNSTTEDDQQTTGKIYAMLEAIRAGRRVVDILPDVDESVRFFVLGLAPNAARLSIRFWEENTVGSFLNRIGLHFHQLAIVRQFENEPEFPPLWRLLCHTATLGKSENVSPVLAGGMVKAMLSGRMYPHNLLAVVLGRIRAEQEVGYFRAALLKAFLVRNKKMEVSMSLDVNRKERPYLLGRLFAVLEKAQAEAIPGATATMRDRFFASAPATPARVFPMLLKNAANHTAKLRKDQTKKGWAFNLEKMIQDIVDELHDFPPTMPAEEQGLFMIGYYQQMKDFYTKKTEEK
jgi:CRISPR-associated protein Csd1